MAADPFPRERFGTLLGHLPAYARLAWRVGRDRRISRPRRAAILAAAGYLVSPVDLVPGIIPIAGQLDDVFVALTALRYALGGLTPDQRRAHLAVVALSEADLRADLDATIATAGWIARSAARFSGRVALGATRRTARFVSAGARTAIRIVRRARSRRA